MGREREVEEVIDVLGKRRTNNPLLVGEPGVGKTALVEGVAQRLLASAAARGRVLVELDMASVVAGTQLRGAFSEKLLGIKDEVRQAGGRVVVFIDEIHTVIGAGATGEGPQDAANELKAALARGEFPCIGATTHDEYQHHIQQDPALERRFTPVLVREPSVADTVTSSRAWPPATSATTASGTRRRRWSAAASLTARYVTRSLPAGQGRGRSRPGRLARPARRARPPWSARDVARMVAKMAGPPRVAPHRHRPGADPRASRPPCASGSSATTRSSPGWPRS